MKIKTTLLIAAIGGMLPLSALSADPAIAPFGYLGIEGSYYDIQKGKNANGDVHNFWQPAVHLGWRMNRKFSVQAQYAYAETEMRHYDEDIKDQQALLGGRLHSVYTAFFDFYPYAGLGYQYHEMKPDNYKKSKDDAAFGELGLQRMLGKHFMLDVGYRHIITLDSDRFTDRQPYVALNAIFGQKKPVRIPMEEEVLVILPEPKCVDVPVGARLDADGCPMVLTQEMRVTLHMEFEFNKTTVLEEYYPAIGEIAEKMVEYPDSTLLLEGHTDNIGLDSYNQNLSRSRAEAVMQVLVSVFEIDPSRIRTTGMGASQPIANNNTEEGRALNRRVEATISGKKEVIEMSY